MNIKKKKVSFDVTPNDWELFKKLTKINHSSGSQMLQQMIAKYNKDHVGDLQSKMDFNN